MIDDLSLEESYCTLTADFTIAYLHVDGDEECHEHPPLGCLDQQAPQQAALGNLRIVSTALKFVKTQTSWRGGTLRTWRPQFLVNYQLEVHMDDFNGTVTLIALEQIQANLSHKIRFKAWTFHTVGAVCARFEHQKRVCGRVRSRIKSEVLACGAPQLEDLTSCKHARTPRVAGLAKPKNEDNFELQATRL